MGRLAAALRTHNLSPGAVALAGGLVGLSLLCLAAPGVAPFVGVSPGSVLTRPWTLLTAAAFDTHAVKALLHAVALLATSTVLEPLWGAPEWARFLAVAGVAANLTSLAASYLAYSSAVAGPAAALLLYTPRAGAAGLVAASLIGVAQAMPDREVTLAQVLKLRMKHVPALYVGGLGAGALLFARGLATLPLLIGGAAAGWTYLRFFQAREGGARGDASAEFRLAAFFPAPVTPVVDAMAGVCDRAIQAVARAKVGADGAGGGGAAAPGGGKVDDAAAQRRRERGQRALEERLKAKAGAVLKPVTDVEASAV